MKDSSREVGRQLSAAPILSALQEWATGPVISTLHDARPLFPPGLRDRAEDVFEPLFAIADLASGPWPARARRSAVRLMGRLTEQDINIELLHDIYPLFDGVALLSYPAAE